MSTIANRYWVGNGGNWSDYANHWSATSGGGPGASLPTSADNVYFDANSFSGTEQMVMVDVAANCLDMDWTGTTNSPTLAGSSTINVYGSLTFITAMSITWTDSLVFKATATGKTVNLAGLALLNDVYFDGVGGEWTLQSSLITGGSLKSLYVTHGSLITGGESITLSGSFNFNNSNTKSISLGASVITVGNWWQANSAGTIWDAGTSTIILAGSSKTFIGGGLTYNNVRLSGTSTTVQSSSTFDTLIIDSGKTAIFTAGTTQTVATLTADGATLQSTSNGSTYTLKQNDGWLIIKSASLRDCIATGNALKYAIKCTNVSGNSGWSFVDSARLAHMAPATTTLAGLMSAKDKADFSDLFNTKYITDGITGTKYKLIVENGILGIQEI